MLCFPVAPNHSLNERGCNLAQIWGRRLQSLEIDCDNDDDNNNIHNYNNILLLW